MSPEAERLRLAAGQKLHPAGQVVAAEPCWEDEPAPVEAGEQPAEPGSARVGGCVPQAIFLQKQKQQLIAFVLVTSFN